MSGDVARATETPAWAGSDGSRARVESRRGRDPWGRARDESAKAYAAFVVYRDLGPERSLRVAAGRLGKSARLLKRWSSRHRWQERVASWEEEQAARAAETSREAGEEAQERWARNSEQIVKVAMAGVRSLMVRDAETGEVRFDERLKPGEIAALIGVAYRIFPTSQAPAPSKEGGASTEALAGLGEEDLELLLAVLEGEKAREEDQEGASDGECGPE
jgi:hypothetical protein